MGNSNLTLISDINDSIDFSSRCDMICERKDKDMKKTYKTLKEIKDKYFPNRSLDELEGKCRHRIGRCLYCERERVGWGEYFSKRRVNRK